MEKRNHNGWEDEPFTPFIEELGQPNAGEPDETSEEDVRYALEALEVEMDAELELETYHTMQMAQRASETLARFGLEGELDSEKYAELCKALEVVPESEEAVYAVEDIFFYIQQQDYDYRDLNDAITEDDLTTETEEMDYDSHVQSMNLRATGELSKIIKDPILDCRMIKYRLGQLRQKQVESMEEYDQLQEEIRQLEEELASIDVSRGIPQVNARRDRAIRHMYRLLRQDFMHPIRRDFKKRMDNGNPLSFAEAAERLAVTRGIDTESLQLATLQWERKLAEVPSKKKELQKKYENGQISQEEKEMAEEKLDNIPEPQIPYLPSIIDQMMNLEKEGDNREGFSRKQQRRASLLDKRLQQAKEICEIVFIPDIRDRIYESVSISEQELERVETMHRIMHKRADTSHLARVLSLMPGGIECMEDDNTVNLREGLEFGGKTKLELMADIGDIIYGSNLIEESELERLQELRQSGRITPEQSIELGEIAIHTLKILIFRYNIPIGRLLS